VCSSDLKGEREQTTVVFDGKAMRAAMSPAKGSTKSALDLLKLTVKASRSPHPDANRQFFEVHLEGFIDPPDECVSAKELYDFVSQVAPVPYPANFPYRAELEAAAKKNGIAIEEVKITIKDGSAKPIPVTKQYGDVYKFDAGAVALSDCEIYQSPTGKWWGWVGKKQESGAYTDEKVSGLRVRVRNIQIAVEGSAADVGARADPAWLVVVGRRACEIAGGISSLLPSDVRRDEETQIVCIYLRPEMTKGDYERVIPVHSHLIDQGFLDFVKKRETARLPLFYDPKRAEGGENANPQWQKVAERLGEWVVKSLKITGVKPNHGWRHRFTSTSREVGMHPEVEAFITGHGGSDDPDEIKKVSLRYGDAWVKTLKRMIEMYPRYEIAALREEPSPRPNETTIVNRMIDDVTVVCTARRIPFHPHLVPSGDGLIRALSEIEAAAQRGLRPMIYLDMHGSAEDGVEIAATGEMVSWDKVVDTLRRINRATGNNLVVVAGVCYGLHAIRESMITDHAPFFMLAASEERIVFGELEDQTFPFFDELTTSFDFDSAKAKLSPKKKVFHCMRVFTVAVGRYIHRKCRGKGDVVQGAAEHVGIELA
jgi:hypothetical protein